MNSRFRSGCLGLMVVSIGLSMIGCEKESSDPTSTGQPATPAQATGEVWPTDEEAKAAIYRVEEPLYGANETWHIKGIKHEVKSVKFAERTTQKQMNFGANAITVYPAKILYTRITEYTDKEPTREEQGADGVWFFYKDSFGEWTGKYGNE